jgi:hypothetical protein
MRLEATAAILISLSVLACGRSTIPPDPDTLGWALHVPHGPSGWPELEPGTPFPDMPWPITTDDARLILARAQTFGGRENEIVSAKLVAFNLLVDAADGVTQFEHVANAGTPAGQLYALCGFQLLDTTRFQDLLGRIRQSEQRVDAHHDDIVGDHSASEIADLIDQRAIGMQMRAARDKTYYLVNGLVNGRPNVEAATLGEAALQLPVRVSAFPEPWRGPVWGWDSACTDHLMTLEVRLDGKLKHKETVPFCRVTPTDFVAPSLPVSIHFVLKPARALEWMGYRTDVERTPRSKPLEIDIWPASAGRGAVVMGVSAADRKWIYMNSLHFARPDQRDETEIAPGLFVITFPQDNARE